MDSGAIHFVVHNIALLDEAYTYKYSSTPVPLATTESIVPVERSAVLFAKINSDTMDPDNIIIQVRALFAFKLQSEDEMQWSLN